MLRSWLWTMTANSQSSARSWPSAARRVVERQDGVADDEHALAGGGADGVVGEADGAVDAVEGDAEDAAAGAHEQRGHDRERQRQADLGRRAHARLGGQQ